MDAEDFNISVVIPAYKSGPYLIEMVEALLCQTHQPLEIIISHSDSDDPTEMLADYHPKVKVLHSERQLFAGAARNRGIAEAKGNWIAMFDEDVIPEPNCLEIFKLKACEYPSTYLFAGAVDYVKDGGGYWGKSLWYIEFGSQHCYLEEKQTQTMAGCIGFVKKEKFSASRGFPEAIRIGEDAIFQLDFQKKFSSFMFIPQAIGRHHNIGGFRYFYHHLLPLGRGAAKVRKMPHSVDKALVKYPILTLLLPFARIALLIKRSLRPNNPRKLQLILLLPGIFIGLCVWSYSFMIEAFKNDDGEK